MEQVNDPAEFHSLNAYKREQLLNLCNGLEKIGKINKNHSSYGLKHLFERHGGYITNGMFKGAMLEAGFKVDNPNDINWCFNVSNRSVKQLYQNFK